MTSSIRRLSDKRRCSIFRGVQRSYSSNITSEQQALLDESKALTLSFYRSCLRSIRAIRHGNEHDRVEFEEREKEREAKLKAKPSDVRLGMLSMMPAGDWEDEMR